MTTPIVNTPSMAELAARRTPAGAGRHWPMIRAAMAGELDFAISLPGAPADLRLSDPASLRQAIDLGRFRCLAWLPDHPGTCLSGAPATLCARFLPTAKLSSGDALQMLSSAIREAFNRGGSFLVLSPHAAPIEAARNKLLETRWLAERRRACVMDASDHALGLAP